MRMSDGNFIFEYNEKILRSVYVIDETINVTFSCADALFHVYSKFYLVAPAIIVVRLRLTF